MDSGQWTVWKYDTAGLTPSGAISRVLAGEPCRDGRAAFPLVPPNAESGRALLIGCRRHGGSGISAASQV